MSVNFREVLRELEERESRLMQELQDIKVAKPAIERMAKVAPVVNVRTSILDGGYAGLGTKDAIMALLIGKTKPLSVAEITKALLGGGIKTRSTDFAGVVKSTLGQLKTDGKVERKEDGWVALPMSPSEIDPSGPLPLSLQ